MDEQEAVAEVKGWLALKLTSGRVSSLLVREIAQVLRDGNIDVYNIYGEIGALEGAPYTRSTNTKPAAPFNRPPLVGLMHKHYSDAIGYRDRVSADTCSVEYRSSGNAGSYSNLLEWTWQQEGCSSLNFPEKSPGQLSHQQRKSHQPRPRSTSVLPCLESPI